VFGRIVWLVDATEPLLRGFNRYAYCFTGIYGFSFFEAGEKVVELFALRGITVLVSTQAQFTRLSLQGSVYKAQLPFSVYTRSV
jgi:Plasma-membrane choline transporter